MKSILKKKVMKSNKMIKLSNQFKSRTCLVVLIQQIIQVNIKYMKWKNKFMMNKIKNNHKI